MRKAVRAIIIRDDKLLVMKRNKFGHKYYTLVGGGVDFDEAPEQSLIREVSEETGLAVKKFRQVFTEEAGQPFGTQYIYLCEDPGGEPLLQPNSDEAKISALGRNTYEVGWLTLEKLAGREFLSERLKQAILDGVKNGFPDTVKKL